MYARMTKAQGIGSNLETAVQQMREEIVPRVRELDGFKGMIALVDREGDTFVTYTLWETQEALQASAEAANQLRGQALRMIGITSEPKVKNFEVAFAEIESPVTA